MKPEKNYIDEHGNYHNIQNLTLTQIYDSGVEEGYRIAKEEKPVGKWIRKPVERDLLYNTGIKYTCPFCGAGNCYGEPPHCMYCGARLEKGEKA